MFATLSLPPRPCQQALRLSLHAYRYQRLPEKSSQTTAASASQHSANHGLICSTDTSPPAIGPCAREESPESQVQVPKPQATSSSTTQLWPAENLAPTLSPSFLDECGYFEALWNGLKPSAMPQHDANQLPLPMLPSPTSSECSTSPVASRVIHCSATVEQEPADSLISSVSPAPIIGPCDERIRNKHTLPISRRPMATRNVEVHRGSADRDSLCRPGPVQATVETADIEIAPLNVTVSVKRRSNPIVLTRLSRTIRDDYAQALDHRESCDLADVPPQTHTRQRQRQALLASAFASRAAVSASQDQEGFSVR
ncbi:hypothetical protein LTR49_022495 [Elasticomyces elasticus]|nr:hypothetical protein LTR49_022495 [Elasticomyces elasticus]